MKITLSLILIPLGCFVVTEAIGVRPIQKTFYKGILNRFRPYRVHPYLRRKYYGNSLAGSSFYGNRYRNIVSTYTRRRIIPRRPKYYSGFGSGTKSVRPVQVSSYRPVKSLKRFSHPKPKYYHKEQPRIPVCPKDKIFVCKKAKYGHGSGKCFSLCKKGKPCLVPCICYCTHKKPVYKQSGVMLKLTSLKVNIPVCHKKEFLRCTARYSYAASHRGCTIACSAGFCGVGCNCVCKFEANLGHGLDLSVDSFGIGNSGLRGHGGFIGGFGQGGVVFDGDIFGGGSGIDIGSSDHLGGGGGKIKEENIEVKIDVTEGNDGIVAAGGGAIPGDIGGADLGLGGGASLDLGALPDVLGVGGLNIGAIEAGLGDNIGSGTNDPILLIDPTQPAGSQPNINIIPGSETPGLDNLGLFPDINGPDLSLDLNAPGALDALSGIPVDPALDAVHIGTGSSSPVLAVGNDPIVDSGAVNDALNLPDFIPDIGVAGVAGEIDGGIDLGVGGGGTSGGPADLGVVVGGTGQAGGALGAIDSGHGGSGGVANGHTIDGGHSIGSIDGGSHGVGGGIPVHEGGNGGGQFDIHGGGNGIGHTDIHGGSHADVHIDVHGGSHGGDLGGGHADGGFGGGHGNGHSGGADAGFGHGHGHGGGIDGGHGGGQIDGGHGGAHGGGGLANPNVGFNGIAGGQVELLDPSLASVLPVAMGRQPDREAECRGMGRRLWCEVRKSWSGTPGLLKWCNSNCSKGACDVDRCRCECVSNKIYNNNMGMI